MGVNLHTASKIDRTKPALNVITVVRSPPSFSRVVVGVAMAACLAACSSIPGTEAYKIGKAKEKVSSVMKDPTSALFSDVRVSADKYVCGNVNAKNSFGAYEGPEGFIVDDSGQVDLEEARSSGNPGIDASNACNFKVAHAACMRGESVLTAKIGALRGCSKAGSDAIRDDYNKKLEALR